MMIRINIYITSYQNEIIEEVESKLSQLGRILKRSRSSVVPQFYFYRLETNDKESIEKLLKEYEEKELISWFKVEVTLSEQ
ncbi:MAG: hypothetical protein ACP5GI_04760 [Sulfolobales archaeon]